MEENKEITIDNIELSEPADISASSILNDTNSVVNAIDDLNLDAYTINTLETVGVSLVAPINEEEAEKQKQDEELQIIETSTPEVEIDLDVDDNNLILPKLELVRVLRYANVMIKKTTNDIEASSVNVTYTDEGKVLYRLKDNMTWVEIEGSCKVSNNKPITKTLSFNPSYLTKLLTTAAKDVLIYEGKAVDQKQEEKDVLYARLINGDLIVDVFYGNEEKLKSPGTKGNIIKSVPAERMSTLCDVMIPLIAETQEVQSKRVIMYEDRAFFRSATYLLQVKGDFCNMCLGRKELDLVKLMSGIDKSGNVDFYNVDSDGENRIIISVPGVKISTSVSIPNRDEVVVGRFNELETAKYMKINKDDFKRVLFLSGLGLNNVGRLTMNYNVDGAGIDARIIGRDGNSDFLISGNNYNNLEPRSENVEIYVPPITVLLKSFDLGKDLEIAFLNSGVSFKDETLSINAIMNYAR